MSCKLCTEKLSAANLFKLSRACASCKKQYSQMRAGFRGVVYEPKKEVEKWDNSGAYDEWMQSLGEDDGLEQVKVNAKEEYTKQRCDIRDMRNAVGLPKLLPLEAQVFTAWVEDGVKDGRMQEALGLTYNQIQHVKAIVRMRLRKQMCYFQEIQKLSEVPSGN
jgi:hypothetical protein